MTDDNRQDVLLDDGTPVFLGQQLRYEHPEEGWSIDATVTGIKATSPPEPQQSVRICLGLGGLGVYEEWVIPQTLSKLPESLWASDIGNVYKFDVALSTTEPRLGFLWWKASSQYSLNVTLGSSPGSWLSTDNVRELHAALSEIVGHLDSQQEEE